MIKRPLHPRFTPAVLAGRKFTTIRDKPWPVGKPIMLYNWSGAAYRSKQTDVAAIIVQGWWPIAISHRPDGTMSYEYGMKNAKELHETEGFATRAELDGWFRPLVKPGQPVIKYLMRFRLVEKVTALEVKKAVAIAQRSLVPLPVEEPFDWCVKNVVFDKTMICSTKIGKTVSVLGRELWALENLIRKNKTAGKDNEVPWNEKHELAKLKAIKIKIKLAKLLKIANGGTP